MSQVAAVRNKLLLALAADDRRRLQLRLEPVPLKFRRTLHLPKLPIEHVYFIDSGLVSVVATTDHHSHAVEAWLIGCEGMAGLPVVLGVSTSPHRRSVQAEGSAWRMSSDDLRRSMDEIPAFRNVLLRYVHSVLVQAAQSGACNAQHTIDQCLARWLLMVQDRLETDDLHLTHDVIANMLGVRRASVTGALQVFEHASILARERGHIRILDRAGLEKSACGCYRLIRAESERVLAHRVTKDAGPDLATIITHSEREFALRSEW